MGRAQYDDYYEEEYEYEYEDDYGDSREPSPLPQRRQQASSRAPIQRRRKAERSPRRYSRDSRDDGPPRRGRAEPDRHRDRSPPPRREPARRPPAKNKKEDVARRREESRRSLDEDFWKASPPPKRREEPKKEEARRPPPRERDDPPRRRADVGRDRDPPQQREQARRPPPKEAPKEPAKEPAKGPEDEQESSSCSRSRSPPRKRASNFADAPVGALAVQSTEPPKQDAPFVLYHNRKRQEPTKAQTFADPAPSFTPLPEPVVVGATIDVQPALVATLMTAHNRNLLHDETKADIEWVPADNKVRVNGAPEQIEKAKKIIGRVMTHSCWGVSADKVRRLITPRKLESALVRLSPMTNLPTFQKLLNPASPTITLGKGPTNEVVLPNPHGVVSRNHCIIELDPDRGAIYAHDCSTNGSFLNSVRLPAQQGGKVLLSHGDELLFTDPASGIREFGYIVNINEMSVKEEVKFETLLPRRMQTDMDRKLVMPDLG